MTVVVIVLLIYFSITNLMILSLRFSTIFLFKLLLYIFVLLQMVVTVTLSANGLSPILKQPTNNVADRLLDFILCQSQ